VRYLLALLLVHATGLAGEIQYEVSGRIARMASVSVSLYGVASPFTAATLSDGAGRFRFKNVRQGAYTIAVFSPANGEARQTIEVGPSTADDRHRVVLELKFQDSDFVLEAAVRRRHTISAKQLSVPDKALREYEDAQKDLARRDVEAATRHLERAVEIAPQYSVAWNNLGTIAYQTRNFLRAEECFREALEADPEAFEPLVNLGGVLVNLRKLDDAWKYNLHAVLVRPADALANSQLGMTYMELGKPELAEKYFVQAVKSDPAHFSHPQLFLAEIHLRRGERHRAAEDLESFLKHHPDWPQAEKMRQTIEDFRR
jgi:tetratricopeptide (TPR) repeat protein